MNVFSATCAAVAVAVLTAVTGCDSGRRTERPASASDLASTAPSTAPSTESPSASPSRTGTPTPAPAGARLVAEALLDADDVERWRWETGRQGTGRRDSPFAPCAGSGGDVTHAAWRELHQVDDRGEPVPEGGQVAQDAQAYASPAAAAEAEEATRQAVRRCRPYRRTVGTSTVEVTYAVIQRRPLVVERTYRTVSGPQVSQPPDYLGLVRYDDVVTLLSATFGEGPNRDGARAVVAAAGRELCAARRPDGPCPSS